MSQALDDLRRRPTSASRASRCSIASCVGHARLWVTKFKVTKEAVADDRKQLSVSVRVDRDKLRARLAELNIAVEDRRRGAAPASAQRDRAAPRHRRPRRARDYGLAAEKDVAGLAALSGALRAGELVDQARAGPGPARAADGDLPRR